MKIERSLIILFCSIHFVLGLDINTVSVSMPAIAEYFKVTPSEASRVIWIYFVVLTSLLVTFGKIGDLKGFKKLYMLGIGIFTIGALFNAIANELNLLILFRIFQAIGASILFSLTPALISHSFHQTGTGRVFGLNYAFTALGGIIGRVFSGYIIQWFSWRGVFLISIPFGIIGLILAIIFIKEKIGKSEKTKFDFIGALLIFIFLFSLLSSINVVYDAQQQFLQITMLVIVCLISGVLFIINERKKSLQKTQLINWKLLKGKKLLSPIISFAYIYIITNGVIYITPFFLRYKWEYEPKLVGLVMAVPSVFQMISGYYGGRFSDYLNIRKICFVATVILTASLLFYIVISYIHNDILLGITLCIYGTAIGLFIPANTNRIMLSTPADSKGSVSSLMTTTIRIGSAIGTALFAGVFSLIIPKSTNQLLETPADLLNWGFSLTFLVGLLISLLAVITTFYSSDNSKKSPQARKP